jgi:hypothetical protein
MSGSPLGTYCPALSHCQVAVPRKRLGLCNMVSDTLVDTRQSKYCDLPKVTSEVVRDWYREPMMIGSWARHLKHATVCSGLNGRNHEHIVTILWYKVIMVKKWTMCNGCGCNISLVHCPDEIRHNSAGIPAVPFKEPLPAYSPSVLSVST